MQPILPLMDGSGVARRVGDEAARVAGSPGARDGHVARAVLHAVRRLRRGAVGHRAALQRRRRQDTSATRHDAQSHQL